MKKLLILLSLGLSACTLAGCTSSYTMTTTSGEVIQTQGKPENDNSTGMTKYADAYGYHRQIKTSDVVQVVEGGQQWNW